MNDDMMGGGGLCPSCDGAGPIGSVCPEKVCAKRGYRFVPPTFHEKLANQAPGSVDPVLGQLIDDYLVVDILGAGGFGTVYLALQQPIQLKAALKLMNLRAEPEIAEMMIEKFRAEAAALASLGHPNVVRLLKYGRFGDMPYLVMEFVDNGRTLKDEIAAYAVSGGTIDHRVTAHVLNQCLNALDAAHQRAIVHRDIKPDNIMLQRVSGDAHFVRVLDFGLAKFVDQRTLTSTTVGTPVYMAPEQLTKGRIGPWTDLYALGIMAYEMFTGLSPFPGNSQQAILTKKVDPSYDPTQRLTERELPAYLVRFFERAIAREPELRFQNAEEFRAGLIEVNTAMSQSPGQYTVTDVSEIVDEVALLKARRRSASAPGLGSSPTMGAQLMTPVAMRTGPGLAQDATVPSDDLRAQLQSSPTGVGPRKKRSVWPFVGVGAAIAAAATVALVLATGAVSGGDVEGNTAVSASRVNQDRAVDDSAAAKKAQAKADEAQDEDESAADDANRAGTSAETAGQGDAAPEEAVDPPQQEQVAPVGKDAPAEEDAFDPRETKFARAMVLAAEHARMKRWDDAMSEYGNALAFKADDAEAKAGLAKASVEKSRATGIAKVKTALENGDLEDADAALVALGDVTSSAYAADVAALRQQLTDAQSKAQARAKRRAKAKSKSATKEEPTASPTTRTAKGSSGQPAPAKTRGDSGGASQGQAKTPVAEPAPNAPYQPDANKQPRKKGQFVKIDRLGRPAVRVKNNGQQGKSACPKGMMECKAAGGQCIRIRRCLRLTKRKGR